MEDKAGESKKWFCCERGIDVGEPQPNYQESRRCLESFPENAISMLTDAAMREAAFLDLTLKFI